MKKKKTSFDKKKKVRKHRRGAELSTFALCAEFPSNQLSSAQWVLAVTHSPFHLLQAFLCRLKRQQCPLTEKLPYKHFQYLITILLILLWIKPISIPNCSLLLYRFRLHTFFIDVIITLLLNLILSVFSCY